MKTIIYLRTSTEDQNPENQKKDCLTLVKAGDDYEVLEEKQSAWKDNKERPVFEELKKQVRAVKVSNIIVWDFDRVYRNRKRFKGFMEFLKAYKVKLHSFRQSWFEDLHNIPSPWDEIMIEFFINILGHFAQEESDKRSKRVKIAYSNRKNKWGRRGVSKRVIDEVLKLRAEGKTIREISERVYSWDSNNNKHRISKSLVHKILQNNERE